MLNPKRIAMIKLNAGNDINGNSRRCYVAIDLDCDIVGVWKENGRGWAALPKALQNKGNIAPQFMVTYKDLRETLNLEVAE